MAKLQFVSIPNSEHLLFYQWRGTLCVRMKPTWQTLSLPTRKTATWFGKAQHTGKLMRTLIQQLLPNPKDKKMQLRLANAMAATAHTKDRNAIQQLQLGHITAHPISLLSKVNVQPGGLQVDFTGILPASSFTAPPGTVSVQLQLQAVRYNLRKQTCQASETTVLELPFTTNPLPSTILHLPLQQQKGDTQLLLMSALYYVDTGKGPAPVYDPQWRPCNVVWME